MDEAKNMKLTNTTLRVGGDFGTSSVIKACVIEEVNGYEAYMVEEIATDNDTKTEGGRKWQWTTQLVKMTNAKGILETLKLWPGTNVTPNRRKVAAKNQRQELI